MSFYQKGAVLRRERILDEVQGPMSQLQPLGCHTTRHAGPHRAAGAVEVDILRIEHDAWINLAPPRPIRLFAITSTAGFTCCTFHDEPRFRASEESPSQRVRQTYPSTPSTPSTPSPFTPNRRRQSTSLRTALIASLRQAIGLCISFSLPVLQVSTLRAPGFASEQSACGFACSLPSGMKIQAHLGAVG